MQLEKDLRQRRAARAQCAAPDAADLLPAEGDHGSTPRAHDRLEPAEHTERAVEASAVGHRVEVRSQPEVVTRPRAPEEVAVRVDLDRETRLPHPACDESMRLVLRRAPMRTVGARAAADHVQLLEAFEHPHDAAVCRRSLSDPSSHQPVSGTSAATTNANGHDPADTVSAKRRGATTPIAASTVC